jgi:hypothetical protein
VNSSSCQRHEQSVNSRQILRVTVGDRREFRETKSPKFIVEPEWPLELGFGNMNALRVMKIASELVFI